MTELVARTAQTLSPEPLAPLWLVGPIAVVAMLVVGGHVILIDRSDQPATRKRIRTVNGLLMMFTIPLIVAAFAFIAPTNTRLFVMTWILVVGLIILVLALALLDIAASFVMHRHERAELRRQVAEARALAAASRQQP